MRIWHINWRFAIVSKCCCLTVLTLFLVGFLGTLPVLAQSHTQIRAVKVNHFWLPVRTIQDYGSMDMTSGWVPNDINIAGWNAEQSDDIRDGSNYVIGMTNYRGYEKVVFGPNPYMNPTGTVTKPIQSYVRYAFPKNIVNGKDVTGKEFADVNPNLMVGTADQVVQVSHSYLGDIEANRTILAWSQENHNNYVITDVKFVNTSNKTFTDVVFDGQFDYHNSFNSWGNNPRPQRPMKSDIWKWYHYYGARPSDSLRVWYLYDADMPGNGVDDMGNPAVEQQGRLIDATFRFMGVLHVSKEPYKNPSTDVNDPLQPRVTWVGTIDVGAPDRDTTLYAPEQYDLLSGQFSIPDLMSDIRPGTMHRMNHDEYGSADNHAMPNVYTGQLAARPRMVFGPYPKFEPGDTIRIVTVVGQAGLSPKMATELGKRWIEGSIQDPPNLPNPETGYFPANFKFSPDANAKDKIKNRWLSTGVDSVHRAVYNALWNFQHNYQIPGTPPPPSMEVTGYPNRAEIKFSDPEAEALPNFAGYRISRRISMLDTAFFQVIAHIEPHELDANLEHVYNDTNVKFGASYYYYVQAGIRVDENDPNALPSSRGKIIWSSRLALPTPEEMEPPRGGTEALDDIRIAPNPYNINDPLVESYGWTDFRGLLFFNLPSKVTIKIFTEYGDLVQTIEHDSPLGAGSLRWDMLTSSQQVIASGVYIAVFEKENGEMSYQKFAVVR